MKRFLLVGEQMCRTFTTNNLAIETSSTMPTVDIDRERQLMDFKRKMAAVRIGFLLYHSSFVFFRPLDDVINIIRICK